MSLLYPFNDLVEIENNPPIVMVSGDGLYVTDQHGKSYLDANAGLWCTSLGFSNEALIRAAEKQLRRLPYYHSFLGRTSEPALELADRLVKLAPGTISHVFFACSGSEAVDSAIKFTHYYNNALGRPLKKKIIARKSAYHGSGIISASLTGMTYCHEGFDLDNHPMVIRTDCPDYKKNARPGETEQAYTDRVVSELEGQILDENPDSIAAFIGEPVIGSGGVIVPPKNYWPQIQSLLKKYDILLIADEIITGFGRTGTFFASDLYSIQPDMMTIAKQLSSAYFPISAVLIDDAVYQTIAKSSHQRGVFGHGFTYGGHPVGAAVALEALNQYKALDIEKKVQAAARYLGDKLGQLSESVKIADVRQVGLMVGVELHRADNGKSVAKQVADHAQDNGVLFRVIDDTIVISPPLITENSHIDKIIAVLLDAVNANT